MEIHHIEENNASVVLGGSKSRAFSVASTAEFINVLSDSLYSNKLLAVVREVMCNAWDAHIMGGVTDKPIKVQITKNELSISDVGPGIHDDLIGPIYCSYGESTKRGDSASTGGFGLGCKAPFAISDTFTVTSAHQGQKTVYALTKSTELTDGMPELRNIVTTPCGDETGITVTIPLSEDWNADTASVYARMVSFWGEMNANIKLEGIPNDSNKMEVTLKDNKLGLKDAAYGFILSERAPHYETSSMRTRAFPRIYVQYGTVVYPVEIQPEFEEVYKRLDTLLNSRPSFAVTDTHYNMYMLLRAEPDSLTVAPSRESLTYSKHAVATLTKLLENAYAKLTRVNQTLQQRVLNRFWEEAFNACISKFGGTLSDLSEMLYFVRTITNFDHAGNADKSKLPKFLSTPDDIHLYFLSARYKHTKKRYNNLVKKNTIKYVAEFKNPRWTKLAKKLVALVNGRQRGSVTINSYRKYVLRTLIDNFDPEIVNKYFNVVRRTDLVNANYNHVSYSGVFDPFRVLLAHNKVSVRNFLETDNEFKITWARADYVQTLIMPKNQKKYDIDKVAELLKAMGFRVECIYANEALQPVKPVRDPNTKVAPKRKGYAKLADVVVGAGSATPRLSYKKLFHSAGTIENPTTMVYTSQVNHETVVNDFENATKLRTLLHFFPDTALVASSATYYNWVTKTGGKSGKAALSDLLVQKSTDQDFLNMLAYSYLLKRDSYYKYLCRIPEVAAKFGLNIPYGYNEIRLSAFAVENFRYGMADRDAFSVVDKAFSNMDGKGKSIIPALPGKDNIKDTVKYLNFITSNSSLFRFLLRPPADGETCSVSGWTKNDRPKMVSMLLQLLS